MGEIMNRIANGICNQCGYNNLNECLSRVNVREVEGKIQDYIQESLESPMPWIGMYIAAASAACSIAMAADALKGFRTKKLWLPCKYFSLNATSLTLLAVTMKLTVDLTTSMDGVNDKLATVSSLVLMSTAIGNFMTSVASMDNNEILLNLTALGILVFTIAVNVCIHIHNAHMGDYYDGTVVLAEEISAIVFMLLLLAMLCSSSLVVPTAKRYIESKYQQMHRITSNEQGEGGKLSIHELSVNVKKYWVMARTGSPQFVLARSALSGTSGLMCLLMAVTLVEAHVRLSLMPPIWTMERVGRTASNYKWSINWILIIQTVAVGLGTIAPLLRWFVAAQFKITEIGQKSLRDEFKVETYWTLRLVEWRESSLPLQIQHQKCRKLIHDAKRLVLNIWIEVQILLVAASKLILFVSATGGSAIFFCFNSARAPNDMRQSGTELDLGRYILLLEGEAELPKKILTSICNEVDNLIQVGRRNKPKNLINLLSKSSNFEGLRDFDSSQVPSLLDQEPPNCWSLPVVTLVSIATALANVANHKTDQLLSSVREGLIYAKLIEKTLDKNGGLASIRNAADVVWIEVELYEKWQGKDLQITGSIKEALEELSTIAQKAVVDFKAGTNDLTMQDPLNWPVRVIAANSMYRISETILKDNSHKTDEELFERLCIMISDILVACLTNVAHVINLKCHANSIKEREESIREAAVLVGGSEEILEIVQKRELPNLDLEKAANIEEWRAFMNKQDNEDPVAASKGVSAVSQTDGV